MAGRKGKKKSRSPRRRGSRLVRSNLAGVPVSSHLVWYAHEFTSTATLVKVFTTKDLCDQYSKAFAEMMITSVTITYRSRLSATTEGSYVMMVLDNAGDVSSFGWTESWFKTIACYPGAKVRKKSQNCTLNWRPSEASDRNFYPPDLAHSVFCLIMCLDWAEASTKINGEFELRVRMRGRALNRRNITFTRLMNDVRCVESRKDRGGLSGLLEPEDGEIVDEPEEVHDLSGSLQRNLRCRSEDDYEHIIAD